MIKKSDLLNKFNNEVFDFYEVSTEIDTATSFQLIDLDILIKFAQKHSIETLFFSYQVIDSDDLMIDEEITDKLKFSENELTILQPKFDIYNVNVSTFDFNNPISLHVYCLYHGFVFFIYEQEHWFVDQGANIPEISAINIASDNIDEINMHQENVLETITQQRKELRQQILNNPDFQQCTNERLRKAFSDKLFKNDKQLQNLFFQENVGFLDITFRDFIEEVWKEYKMSK